MASLIKFYFQIYVLKCKWKHLYPKLSYNTLQTLWKIFLYHIVLRDHYYFPQEGYMRNIEYFPAFVHVRESMNLMHPS